MNKHLHQVREFHKAFGYPQDVGHLTHQQVDARLSFTLEELAELYHAKASGSLVGQLDAVVDLCYYSLGVLAILGRPVGPERWDEAAHAPKPPREGCDYLVFKRAMDLAEVQQLMPDLAQLTQALSDVCHACKNYATYMVGADFDLAFDEVQRSNMSKLDKDGNPIYNQAGKILKSDLFSEPQLEQFIKC